MPDIQKAFSSKPHKDEASKGSTKRKQGKEVKSPDTGKKRKLDELKHAPTLVSSTFNPLEDVDFPRGGSALTPLERKEAESEGIRDALFEVDILH